MRSIERRFNEIERKHPFWSSYICFAETIKNRKFSRQALHRWFYKLVEKDDYDRKDKRAIFAHLESL